MSSATVTICYTHACVRMRLKEIGMDPIEVRDWTRGEIQSTLDMIQPGADMAIRGPRGLPIRLSDWQVELIRTALEIAGDL